MPPQLKDVAVNGFAAADLYDQHRPSYPPEAVDKLLDALKVTGLEGADILDLAAGTGKFTELLARRPENYTIEAVEPHKGMRETLERKALERVKVKDGLSTEIPAEDEQFDAVIAAQAMHWMADPDSLHEIHRVLKGGSHLGMIWNIEDYNQTKEAEVSTKWENRLREQTHTFDDGQPRFRHSKWAEVFDKQLKKTPFPLALGDNSLFTLPLGRDEVKWTVWLTKDALWKRYRTLSQVAILEGSELENFKRTFDDILQEEDVETNERGEIALHGATIFAWTMKIPDAAPPI